MKKISSLVLALFTAITISAQLTVQTVSPGVVKLTYGATNDYTLYDPGFEVPTFYVHTWSNPTDNTTATMYDDSWTNSNVTMNWDATAGAYIGTIDLATKIFTNGNKTFSGGTTINNMGFVFKDLQNGATKQSLDLSATTYGFTATTLPLLATTNVDLSKKSVVINGKLHTFLKGNVELSVYEMSGKLVKNLNVKADGNAIDLNVSKTGLYLVKITSGTYNEIVKFSK
jgi:hypothetical protein